MGLESLSTVFNDLSKNQTQQPQQVAGQTNPPPVNPQYEELVNFTPLGDIMENQDVLIIPPPPTTTPLDNIVPIQPITQGQFPSPLSDSNSNYQEVSEANLNIRRNVLQPTLGTNNRLGVNDFILESLYNVNHTAVTNREPISTGQFDYDGDPLLINTLRAGMGDLTLLDIKSHNDRFRGNEPYIVNGIGSDSLESSNRDFFPIDALSQDASRFLSFYTSPKGLTTIVKENIQSKIGIAQTISVNPFKDPAKFGSELAQRLAESVVAPATPNSVYGLLGTSFDINKRFPTAIEYSKKFYNPFTIPTKIKPKKERSALGQKIGGKIKNIGDAIKKKKKDLEIAIRGEAAVALDSMRETTAQLEAEAKAEKAQEEARKVAAKALQDKQDARPSTFFDLSGFGNHSDEVGLFRQHGYDDKLNSAGGLNGAMPFQDDDDIAPEGKGDFYVRFRDLRTGNDYLYFRGFVTGITENVSPSFTPTNYIGRSEPVYVYERAERDISFNLRVYPNNELDMKFMYAKLEKLTSLAYPMYLPEKDASSNLRMKAPFTEMYMAHIGTRTKGQFGFIKSISYTVSEQGDWDAESVLPRLFDIALSYQILNRKPPSITTPFYMSDQS